MWYRRKNYNDVRTGDVIEVFEIIEINVPLLKVFRVPCGIRRLRCTGMDCLM